MTRMSEATPPEGPPTGLRVLTARELQQLDFSREPKCRLEGDEIVLPEEIAGYAYAIELDRCNTAAKILVWVIHLAEKTWATPALLENFALLACQAASIELPYHC